MPTPAILCAAAVTGPSSQDAVVVAGVVLATWGWLYNARLTRTLSRKQHTITVIMQGDSDDTYRNAQATVSPHVNKGESVCLTTLPQAHQDAFKLVLNRYEFLAAGIRNGSFHEALVSDALRGGACSLYEVCKASIVDLRALRGRPSLYEHLEWLHDRWERKHPKWPQRTVEWLIDKPLYGKRM